MKSLMTKTVKVFKENIWLSVVAAILLFCMGLAGWKFSLHIARISQNSDSINILVERDAVKSDIAETTEAPSLDPDKVYVSLHGNNAYLYNAHGNQVFGPCKSILLDRNYYYGDVSVFRYVDKNGLIGYGKV